MTPSQLDQIKKDQRRSEAKALRTRGEYKEVVDALDKVFEVLPAGVSLAKGGVGELAMAHHLGHTLVDGDKGADARDSEGLLYEYKVSVTNQFNFNHGARRPEWQDNKETIERHFQNIEGVWIGHREGMQITEKAYLPTSILLPNLLEHFERTKGGQLTKNFRLKQFKELNNV
jgi:hypothetical protein